MGSPLKKKDGESMLEGTPDAEMLEKLAERVEKAVAAIGDLRRDRDRLRARVEELEKDLESRTSDAARLGGVEEENERFRTERDEIRTRIETVLDRLDALESAVAAE